MPDAPQWSVLVREHDEWRQFVRGWFGIRIDRRVDEGVRFSPIPRRHRDVVGHRDIGGIEIDIVPVLQHGRLVSGLHCTSRSDMMGPLSTT